MKNRYKKAVSLLVAMSTVFALLLAGTLAYVQNDQHRSSYLLTTPSGMFDLTLLNNFKAYGKTDWAQGESVANPIKVQSEPDTAEETYVNAYVAIQLKEYIAVASRGDWVTTPDGARALFAINESGAYMSYAETVAAGITDCVKYPAAASNDDAFAIINGTQAAADNNAMLGIHGKPKRAENTTFIYGDRDALEAVLANGAQPVASDECEATPIDGWEAAANESARDYVSFDFGDVILYADWLEAYNANPASRALYGAFWILCDNGWAYWAQALEPGTSTTEIIKNITLEQDVKEVSYYMHVDMVAASLDDIETLSEKAAMPAPVLEVLKGKSALPDWAVDAGLTGTAVDIGKVFAADSYEWVVLDVDSNGNMLIVATGFKVSSTYQTAAPFQSYADMDDSQPIKKAMGNIFQSLHTLRPYAMGANLPIETGAWSQARNEPEAWTSCTNNTADACAFLLSMSDCQRYFTGELTQYMDTTNGTGTNGRYWLRSPGGLTNNGSGIMDRYYVTYSITLNTLGVRPALYINLT